MSKTDKSKSETDDKPEPKVESKVEKTEQKQKGRGKQVRYIVQTGTSAANAQMTPVNKVPVAAANAAPEKALQGFCKTVGDIANANAKQAKIDNGQKTEEGRKRCDRGKCTTGAPYIVSATLVLEAKSHLDRLARSAPPQRLPTSTATA